MSRIARPKSNNPQKTGRDQAEVIERMGDPVGYIFLSYSRKDKGIAEQLESQLKAAGYEMWIDVEGIRGGDLWREAIVKAIDQADALLALLSPNSAKSDNVCTELVLATENKTRIVPVDISTPPISIPSRMRYLLAGKQRVKYPTEFEKLLEALGSSSVGVEAQQAVSARDEGIPAAAAPAGPPPPLAASVSKQGCLLWLGIGLAAVALMIAVGAICLLVGQSSNGGTPGGTGITESEAGQTAMIPTTVTPTDIPTATPTATPQVGDYFERIWQGLGADKRRLGDPKNREIISAFVVQKFDKGIMYWLKNPQKPEGPHYIWVLVASTPYSLDGTRWAGYSDDWKPGDEYTCDGAPEGERPKRGFDKIWCKQKLWNWLGACKPAEQGSNGNLDLYGRLQLFQGGAMLYNPIDKEVYVLFNQLDWKLVK
jgi:hypothetical protein